MKDSKGGRGKHLESYRIELPEGATSFTIRYGGMIDHPLEPVGKEQARGYSHTIGKITEEGVYLSGSTHWYPVIDVPFITFSLTVELPKDWEAVSQGVRTVHQKDDQKTVVRWSSPEPQEEIYLVAGTFHEYGRPMTLPPAPSSGSESGERIVHAMVFLRSPDPELAEKYLEATVRYVRLYGALIGPYPYGKFALIENFWETGFGMPSFTLLGPRVIRLPFIVNTSYPHEILHSWWGNGVIPAYEEGNWSEGLTAYLSDHLNAEARGEGWEYRQTTLQKYTDYVTSGKDFPLTAFRSRHSPPSEAIGYGKSLMFFHMLRQELGDRLFMKGLQDFYRNHVFRFASFGDLRRSFERVSGKNLEAFFSQWITRSGGPEVTLSDVRASFDGNAHSLRGVVRQVQRGEPYRFSLPLAVTLEGERDAHQVSLQIDERRVEFSFRFEARPRRVDVDPEYDVFRRLHRREIPPAITQVLGAEKMTVILPSAAKPPVLSAYRALAEMLRNSGPDSVTIALDKKLRSLPSDAAVCVLGAENRFRDSVMDALARFGVRMSTKAVRVTESELPFESHSFVFTGQNPANEHAGLLFVTSDNPSALIGLGRKLPHYHKYSYLVFRGDEPVNVLKGRWKIVDSPLTAFLPDKDGAVSQSEMGTLRKRHPLSLYAEEFSSDSMRETVNYLAGDELKGRGLGTRGIELAAEFIARRFSDAHLLPAGDDDRSYFQTWREEDGEGRAIMLKNVVGVLLPVGNDHRSTEGIVVGAHYDHVGFSAAENGREFVYYPGADDNASGIAVLIELARVLAKKPLQKKIFFVAFTGEESGRKGSRSFLTRSRRYGDDRIVAMVNIDTVGRLGNKKVLIFGADSAPEWKRIVTEASRTAGVDIDIAFRELDASDQKSFHEKGIPAIQLSSGPHPDYHRTTDTPDKIDLEGMERIARFAQEVIEHLAARENPLTAAVAPASKNGDEQKGQRGVTFGIVPDFAHPGPGCRVAGIVPGSSAEKGGLREGDIIVRINDQTILSLKDYADILRTLKPGDTLRVVYRREGQEMTTVGEVRPR